MNPCQPVTESFSVFSRKICFVLYFFGYLGLSKNSGVKCDLILALLGQIFEYLRETLYRHALEYLQSACSEKNKNDVFPPRNRLTIVDFLKACGRWGNFFATSTNPT